MTRRLALGPAALASGLVIAVGACSGDGPSQREVAADERAAQVAGLLADAGFPSDAIDIGVALAASPGTRHTVDYRVGDGAAAIEVHIVNDPPRRRVDVSGPRPPRRVTITEPDRTVGCADSGDGWVCGEGAGPDELAAFSPTALADAVLDLARSAERFTFEVTDTTIADTPARCLVTTRRPDVDPTLAAERAELCVSPDGVALLVRGTGPEMRATAYSSEIAADAFEPPAEVEPDIGLP